MERLIFHNNEHLQKARIFAISIGQADKRVFDTIRVPVFTKKDCSGEIKEKRSSSKK